MGKLMPKHVTPEVLELYKVLQQSKKFQEWKPERRTLTPQLIHPPLGEAQEKHYTVIEAADLWNVSTDLIRDTF